MQPRHIQIHSARGALPIPEYSGKRHAAAYVSIALDLSITRGFTVEMSPAADIRCRGMDTRC